MQDLEQQLIDKYTQQDHFELEFGGKAYQLLKLGPLNRGAVGKTLARLQGDYLQIEGQDPSLDWVKAFVASAMGEHLPPLIWEFIRPEHKPKIGTLESFHEVMFTEIEQLFAFQMWCVTQTTKAQRFLANTPPAPVASPSQSEPSSPSSAGDTAGQTTIANS